MSDTFRILHRAALNIDSASTIKAVYRSVPLCLLFGCSSHQLHPPVSVDNSLPCHQTSRRAAAKTQHHAGENQFCPCLLLVVVVCLIGKKHVDTFSAR